MPTEAIDSIGVRAGETHPRKDKLELLEMPTQIAKFMGPTWGPPGSCRPHMGPMLATRTLLLGNVQEMTH